MRLEDLVAAVLEVPASEITDETAPHSTGEWTSKAHIQLVVAIEEIYRVSLSVAEIKALTSVGAARRLLAGKGVAPA
ncbi:acyl carrier protein [Microbispora sp. NBC_01189]|uniref:acyl carrier protein n=1 Tax=Microbispora sp. NBC_01189 TaxID=2903583 RepID=UPI002E0FF5BB|nr:acyl carrier protein [Microbispora sp. NBC_01189]